MNKAVEKEQTGVFPVRIPIKYKQMLDDTARRNGQNRNYLASKLIIDGLERINTDIITENSKITNLINDLKDFLSTNISKTENRIASLMSHSLITAYENREMNEELLRLIVGQLYEATEIADVIEEAKRKVNTAAIVKIKNQVKLSLLLK